MKRKFFCFSVAFVLVIMFYACAFSETQEELKQMSGFLNNFTELNLFNFDTNSEETDGEEEGILHLGNPFNVSELIRFGIRHNYIRNNAEAVKRAPNVNDYGSFVIEGKFVSDTVKKFFGIDIKNQSVLYTEPSFYYDGKYYYFEPYEIINDGETIYYTDVKQINKNENILEISGEIYDSQNINERPGKFTAYAKIIDNNFIITSITTDWRHNENE